MNMVENRGGEKMDEEENELRSARYGGWRVLSEEISRTEVVGACAKGRGMLKTMTEGRILGEGERRRKRAEFIDSMKRNTPCSNKKECPVGETGWGHLYNIPHKYTFTTEFTKEDNHDYDPRRNTGFKYWIIFPSPSCLSLKRWQLPSLLIDMVNHSLSHSKINSFWDG